MAKSLGLAPSVLSNLLRGNRNLSFNRSLEIAEKLGLDIQETEYFSTLVQMESIKEDQKRSQVIQKLQNLRRARPGVSYDTDQFKFISDWYHVAIVEFFTMDWQKPSPEKIARRLAISKFEVEEALDRLQRIGLLEAREDGAIRKVTENFQFTCKGANSALRKFHKQMITKAVESIETQAAEERWLSSRVMAIDPQDLEEARPLVTEFMNSMQQILSRGKNKTEVYHLGTQLFKLTKEQDDESA